MEMEKGNWQKRAKNFRQVKYGSPSTDWTKGLEYRLEKTKKLVAFKDKKVLDVGCGVGMFMSKFKKLGSDVYGIDVDKEKIKIAKKSFKNVFASPSEKLPFRKNSFDVVWLHEVIEHVDDDKQTITECFRVLKSGGKLIIFAPNRLWPFETHGIFFKDKYRFGNKPIVPYLPNKWYDMLTPHVKNYFKGDIFKLLNQKGISYKKIAYSRIYPGFDKLSAKIPVIGKLISNFFKFLNKTPLNAFGISHFVIVEKV